MTSIHEYGSDTRNEHLMMYTVGCRFIRAIQNTIPMLLAGVLSCRDPCFLPLPDALA